MNISLEDLHSFDEANQIVVTITEKYTQEALAILALECLSYLLLAPEHPLWKSSQAKKLELFESVRKSVWK